MPFVVRTMTRNEVDYAVGLAATEGWNPGQRDADAFFAADPAGFLIGLLDDRPIGSISAVRYPGDFGFIGFYVVEPAYRGQGFGFQLWQAAMARLEGCNIGLDGVVAQQDNYRKSGFRLAYRNIRFALPSPAMRKSTAGDFRIVKDLQAIRDLDRSCFPSPRDSFLSAWVKYPTLAAYEEDLCVGYGTIRPCLDGFKVGPLFARDAFVAESLLASLTSAVEGPIFLDVPEANPPSVALAEHLGITRVFETARMYTGDPPPIRLDQIFGVTSFELG